MRAMNFSERIKHILDPKRTGLKARLFVCREDGISVYDFVSDSTRAQVSALVSGMWQASEALVRLIDDSQEAYDFRLGFDTSSSGVFLLPFNHAGKKYFLGALYSESLNPGVLKHQVTQVREELISLLGHSETKTDEAPLAERNGYLFTDITDEEIDRLFGLHGKQHVLR
jgi:hypothetical protein